MKFSLEPHPDHPALGVRAIEAAVIGVDRHWLTVRWKVDGSSRVVFPPFAGKGRADNLWQTTCFEMFLQPVGEERYVELNLSPSERWAAYDFDRYREGMRDRPLPRQPDCTIRKATAMAIFDAAIPRAGLPELPWRMGIAAVIEEEGGVKSFWALAHGPARPDFHDPACFALALGPDEAA